MGLPIKEDRMGLPIKEDHMGLPMVLEAWSMSRKAQELEDMLKEVVPWCRSHCRLQDQNGEGKKRSIVLLHRQAVQLRET